MSSASGLSRGRDAGTWRGAWHFWDTARVQGWPHLGAPPAHPCAAGRAGEPRASARTHVKECTSMPKWAQPHASAHEGTQHPSSRRRARARASMPKLTQACTSTRKPSQAHASKHERAQARTNARKRAEERTSVRKRAACALPCGFDAPRSRKRPRRRPPPSCCRQRDAPGPRGCVRAPGPPHFLPGGRFRSPPACPGPRRRRRARALGHPRPARAMGRI